ncbi:OmpA family protein [Roseomonas sp. BN140053]|uniref:OmpA family protein n=1 Tax=Roseomonas sp. BN140053 TaxID=3391898 RepID=UPI0039EB2DF2
MKLRQALLAATVLSAPTAAMAQSSWLPTAAAQPVTGLYIGAGAGWNHLDHRNMTAQGGNATYFDTTRASRQGNIDFNEGFAGVVSLGWGFGNGVRAEIEGSYRYNDLDKLGGFPGRNGGGASSAFRNFNGEQQQYGVMANAFYDFQLPRWFPQMPIPVVPYIGGGAGYIWNDLDVRGTRLVAGGNTVDIDDRVGHFAYQGIAGLAFPITAVPGLSLTAEYRYMGQLQGRFDGQVRNPQGGVVSRGKFEVDQPNNHSAMLGLRYALYTPAAVATPVAPPPVSQQPAPARTYLVFFDWDRADLTDRARQIISEAAQNARRVSSTRIEVAGHADRSGTPQYNQRLSQRRAEAVAAELARQGISRSEMSIQAFGESRPLVATADGVREPQNRRVEIILR